MDALTDSGEGMPLERLKALGDLGVTAAAP
jgi:hypothetical protein